MPQSGMDWWVVAGVIIAAIAAFITWRQSRGNASRTTNKIIDGNNNTQTGGKGRTKNTIKRGDNNTQGGT